MFQIRRHLTRMENRIMAELDDLKAAVTAAGGAITALATEQTTFLKDIQAKIAALEAQITTAGLDPTLLTPITASIQAQVANLQALTAAQVAADPVTPPAPAPAV